MKGRFFLPLRFARQSSLLNDDGKMFVMSLHPQGWKVFLHDTIFPENSR